VLFSEFRVAKWTSTPIVPPLITPLLLRTPRIPSMTLAVWAPLIRPLFVIEAIEPRAATPAVTPVIVPLLVSVPGDPLAWTAVPALTITEPVLVMVRSPVTSSDWY